MATLAWSEVTVPTVGGSSQLRDFCSLGADGFCAVGDAGLVYTSPDGLIWTKQTAAAANNWRGVAYDGSRIVAVSSTGANRVMTSDNLGVTWASQSAAEANQWQSVTWADGLSLFVAVANSGTHRVMTSADGASWSTQTAAAAIGWTGICWSEDLGLLCAVAGNAPDIVQTSPDGAAWTRQTTPASVSKSGTISGSSIVQWSPDAAVFAFASVNVTTRSVTTSPDGAVWTEHALPNTGVGNGGIVAAPAFGGFIISRQNGTNDRIDTSPDGAAWTAVDPGFYRLWDCAGWNDDLGVFVTWDNVGSDTMLYGQAVSFDTLSPSRGTRHGGTIVTLHGTGFGGVTTGDVLFGGTAATDVTPASDGLTLTCLTPAHAVGTVDVAITGVGTLTDAYTFVSVDRVTPKSGSTAGGQAVTVTGFGFNLASGVLFGTKAATAVVIVSDTSITCLTPAHESGAVDVTVSDVDVGTALYTYAITKVLLPPIPVLVPIIR